ncbi:hypothetical protein BCR59_27650 [Klebsiella pneumoniae]|nr:hypothetical protein BCR59_27650 [Klebsiella pneumoniae]
MQGEFREILGDNASPSRCHVNLRLAEQTQLQASPDADCSWPKLTFWLDNCGRITAEAAGHTGG